jgi:hypothetical protein
MKLEIEHKVLKMVLKVAFSKKLLMHLPLPQTRYCLFSVAENKYLITAYLEKPFK